MLTKRSVLLSKIESTYGTDSTPGGTDAVRVENLQINPAASARMHERPAIRGTLGTLKHVYGGSLGEITFDVPVAGSGTAGTAPEFDSLLRACAMGSTIVAGTSVTYSPVSSGFESTTIKFYEDGTLYALTGAVGNVSLNAEAGKFGVLSFTMTGHIAAVSDASLVSGTFDTAVPPVFLGASFAIDSYAAVISAFSFDLQNTIAMPPSVNSADGFAAIRVTGRDVVTSFDPEKVTVATEAFEANWRSGAAMALATGTIGGTAGNRWSVSMPAVSYRELSKGDRDGIVVYELSGGAAEDSGDDEISVAFT